MKKESKVNQAKYVELNLFPEEKEDHQKDSISSEDMESDTSPDKEYDLTDLFERLSKSAFRSRFHLSKKDKEYIAEKGLATIRKHAEDFVAKRLAPAVIPLRSSAWLCSRADTSARAAAICSPTDRKSTRLNSSHT